MILRSLPPVVAGAFAVLAHTSAQATSLATFVSGTGTDAGACPITAPCKTFSYALTQTTAGGTIMVLTGGSFGPVNVAKSVAIVADGAEALIESTLPCGDGSSAGICVTGGTVVHLRGLTIDLNGAGAYGIRFTTAKALHLQNCVIRRASDGIRMTALNSPSALFMSDSTIADNSNTGIEASADGGGFYSIVLDRVHIDHNSNTGLEARSKGANKAFVRNSVIAENSFAGIDLFAGGGSVDVMVDQTAVLDNGLGLRAADASAVARIGDSTVTGNATGLQALGAGQVLSYKTNDVAGNAANGAPTGTLTMK